MGYTTRSMKKKHLKNQSTKYYSQNENVEWEMSET